MNNSGKRRGRPPGSKKYDGHANAPVPMDLQLQLADRARTEGTSVAALIRRVLYREFDYTERRPS